MRRTVAALDQRVFYNTSIVSSAACATYRFDVYLSISFRPTWKPFGSSLQFILTIGGCTRLVIALLNNAGDSRPFRCLYYYFFIHRQNIAKQKICRPVWQTGEVKMKLRLELA